MFQSTKVQLGEGLREKIQNEMNGLESQMVQLNSRLDGQQNIIEKQLRTVFLSSIYCIFLINTLIFCL